MNKKRGISLIVLVITIIVIVILAGAVILSLASNNPISQAAKATFLSDVSNFKSELVLYETKQFENKLGAYDATKLQADEVSATYDGNIISGVTMDDLIPTLGKATKYNGQFQVVNGELIFQGSDTNKQNWATQAGIEVVVAGEPKITIIAPDDTLVSQGMDLVYTVKFTSNTALTTIDLTGKVEVIDDNGVALAIQPDITIGTVSGTSTDSTRQVDITIKTNILLNGAYKLRIKAGAVTNADNISNLQDKTAPIGFDIDNTAPENPTMTANPTTFTSGDVTVTIVYSSDSAIKEYSLDGTTWNTYTTPVVVSVNNTTVYARGKDAAGNESGVATLTVANIDKTAPTLQITPPAVTTITSGGDIEYVLTFADGSGVLNMLLTTPSVNTYVTVQKDAGINIQNIIITDASNNIISTGGTLTADSLVRKIVLKNVTGSGSIQGITIAAGAAEDQAGNQTQLVTDSTVISKPLYSEDFSTLIYRGSATTANWNTGSLWKTQLSYTNGVSTREIRDDSFSAAVADGSNIICVGSIYDSVSGSSKAITTVGSADFVIAKYNKDTMARTIQSNGGTSYDFYMGVTKDSAGKYIAVGSTQSDLSSLTGTASKGSTDYLITKYNSDLTINKIVSNGGSTYDTLTSVYADSDGSYVAAGYSNSDLTAQGGSTSLGGTDFLVVKFDNNLNIVKTKNFGGSSSDALKTITKDSDGNYIVAGYSSSDLTAIGGNVNASTDFVIIKLDSNLNILSVKNFGGASSDTFSSVIVDSDGNYVVGGDTWSDLSALGNGFISNPTPGSIQQEVVIKFDKSLNIIKAFNLGNTAASGNSGIYGIVELPTKEYVISGSSAYDFRGFGGNNAAGFSDFFVAKLSSDLRIQSIVNNGGANNDMIYSAVLLSDGTVAAVGTSGSNLNGVYSGFPSNTSNGNAFVVLRFSLSGTLYNITNNTLVSNAIQLGTARTQVKINANMTIPASTAVAFYISVDGTNWTSVSNANLNGTTNINLPSSSSVMYWKATLTGTTTATPKISSITIN